MNNLINSIVNWIKSHRLLVMITAVLLLVLFLWFFVAGAINGVSSWWYSRGTQQQHEEIQKLTNEAAQAKQVAADALKALEQEKQVTEAERKKRELAEQLLNDRSKTTNEKLKIYQEAMDRAPTVTPIGDVDDLCKRAAALGAPCE